MQIKKGKTLFSYKDTWNLNTQLSKVIVSGLLKFKEVINAEEGRKGVPASISCYLVEQGEISYEDGFSLSDEDWEKAYAYFDYVLDEMIFAFSDNEPDIMAYDFKHNMIRDDVQDDSPCVAMTIECTNEEESTRYNKDMVEYGERCEKGRELFAKFYDGLWW